MRHSSRDRSCRMPLAEYQTIWIWISFFPCVVREAGRQAGDWGQHSLSEFVCVSGRMSWMGFLFVRLRRPHRRSLTTRRQQHPCAITVVWNNILIDYEAINCFLLPSCVIESVLALTVLGHSNHKQDGNERITRRILCKCAAPVCVCVHLKAILWWKNQGKKNIVHAL